VTGAVSVAGKQEQCGAGLVIGMTAVMERGVWLRKGRRLERAAHGPLRARLNGTAAHHAHDGSRRELLEGRGAGDDRAGSRKAGLTRHECAERWRSAATSASSLHPPTRPSQSAPDAETTCSSAASGQQAAASLLHVAPSPTTAITSARSRSAHRQRHATLWLDDY